MGSVRYLVGGPDTSVGPRPGCGRPLLAPVFSQGEQVLEWGGRR